MRAYSALFAAALLTFAGTAFAAENLPPGFNAQKWNQLIDRIEKDGKPMNGPDGAYMTLTRMTPPDATKPHQAEYISTIGEYSQGQYFAGEVSAVSENWQIDAQGNWDVNQWIYEASVDGELYDISHIHLVETPDGAVLQDDSLPPSDASDPVSIADWGKKIQEWDDAIGLARLRAPNKI